MNYGSKHATVQNEVSRTNAYKFIVCLAELIRVDIWSVRESLLPLLQTEAQVSLLQFRKDYPLEYAPTKRRVSPICVKTEIT